MSTKKKSKTQPKTIWNYGKPPSIGWWPASICQQKRAIRWWNGKVWSVASSPDCDKETAAKDAAIPSGNQLGVQWSQRWWTQK